MNILSLFDGLSCGQIAINKVGIKYDNYYASEIDQYAIKVTQHNYPNTIQLGDITKIKIKTLQLSEVYSYIYNYDNNIQSNFREWEMLYWLNKEFTISAKIGTQKSNERQEVSKSSILQRIEEIRISKRNLGSISKFEHNKRGGGNGEKIDIGIFQQLQCSEWWYDNDIYRRYKEKNIRKTERKNTNFGNEKKNIRDIENTIFRYEDEGRVIEENERNYVETGCEGESFERSGENKLGGKVKKKEGNGRKEKNDSIEEIIRELCSWDENDRIIENHWDILQLYKNEQVTMVECELGFHIFKGEVNIIFGGSPCQSFSSAGNRTGFDGKSGLFWEYVRILNEVKPKYFLLENVKMKKEWEDIITKEMGVEPISINSNLVSAQNRERLYWTNIPNIIQPENRNIKLTDVLGDSKFREIPKCFYNKWGNKPRIEKGVNWVCNDKSNCLTTKNCHTNQYLFNEDKSLCRLLTADEFEKLQTIPEGYTSVVSNTERYKMIGNGWTVDVISHIFSSLK